MAKERKLDLISIYLSVKTKIKIKKKVQVKITELGQSMWNVPGRKDRCNVTVL